MNNIHDTLTGTPATPGTNPGNTPPTGSNPAATSAPAAHEPDAPASPSPGQSARLRKETWGNDLDKSDDYLNWLWLGYMAKGNLTVLTSQAKTGKTTLLAMLLAERERGGSLAGQPVATGVTAVVSEEPEVLWKLRREKHGFGDNVCFFCQPCGRPTRSDWHALVERLLDLQKERGVDLVVLDPLVKCLPVREENHAGSMLEALGCVEDLTGAGLAVALLHHPRKGSIHLGQAARGSSVLAGHADIVLEMHRLANVPLTDRRRRLLAFSRYPQTPPLQFLEMNAEGTDYDVLELDSAADDFPVHWQRLAAILRAAGFPLYRVEILARWTYAVPPPSARTLWRWLTRACAEGLAVRTGSGAKGDAFAYAVKDGHAELAAPARGGC